MYLKHIAFDFAGRVIHPMRVVDSIRTRLLSGAYVRQMSRVPEHNEEHRSRPPKLTASNYTIGICLLLVVVILWTSSNFVTQVNTPANQLGTTNDSLVYVYWWLSEALHVRSGFPGLLAGVDGATG